MVNFAIVTALTTSSYFLLFPLHNYNALRINSITHSFKGNRLTNNEQNLCCVLRLSAFHDSNEKDEEKGDVDQLQPLSTGGDSMTRRHLFQIVTASAVSSSTYFAAGKSSGAFPEDEEVENGGIIDRNRDGKIVLRTSKSNLPAKYEKTALSEILEESTPVEINLRQQPSSNALCTCESTEQRRIRVFERSAPSVVYIDTYAVQRDAFSPNM